MAGATVVILGEQVAIETGDEGYYHFDAILPGDYTIYAYTDGTDYYRDDFAIVEGMGTLDWRVMLDVCVDNQLSTLSGKITDNKGNGISNAVISVDDLFLNTTSGKDGNYSLNVPPGGWTISVNATGFKVTENRMVFTAPDEPGMKTNEVKYDFKLSR